MTTTPTLATYTCHDDEDGSPTEISAVSPEAAAQAYINSGDWCPVENNDGVIRSTWIRVYVQWDDDTTSILHTIDPAEPTCARGHEEHDWCSPHKLLGGLTDNPGVQGHGGGVICRQVCRHCGRYRVTDTWAQDPSTGEQGLESVEYRPADDASLEWAAEQDAAEARQ